MEKFREDNIRQGFFEAHEFDALVSHLPSYLKDFVRFAYLSGWRKGEIAGLEWRDITDVIRLRPEISKTHEGRVLAIVGDLGDIIARRREARHELTPWVFHHQGEPISDFRKAWKTACRKAGCDGKLFHDLRRTAVRNMVRAGVPEKVAMAISGHRTRSIFDRYNIVNESDIEQGLLKTQQHLRESNVTPLFSTEQSQSMHK